MWAGLYLECRWWKTLPNAGGILDQPANAMTRFRLLAHEALKVEREEVERATARAKADAALRDMRR